MRKFLDDVIVQVLSKNQGLENLVFVLPSKRSGSYLRKRIPHHYAKAAFSPQILSIEEFIEQIARLKSASSTDLLFELYNTYSLVVKKSDFESFIKWGQTVLSDFNEIDRQLIEPNKFLFYLSEIHKIRRWDVDGKKSSLVTNYVNFWNDLRSTYHLFGETLIKKKLGYQGLLYKMAAKRIDEFAQNNTEKKFIFLGFNAFNKAEEVIFGHLLQNNNADIYWDIDTYFLNDPIHSAAYFIRKYQNEWQYYTNRTLQGISSYYLNEKRIEIIGVPNSVSQAKYVGHLLKNHGSASYDNTALVLSDESLLKPILQAVPSHIEAVNITMGLALQKTPLANFFSLLIDLHSNRTKDGFRYQDVLHLLSNPYTSALLPKQSTVGILKKKLQKDNYIRIKQENLIMDGNSTIFSQLFGENYTVNSFMDICQKIANELGEKYSHNNNRIELAYLGKFHLVFNQIIAYLNQYSFLRGLSAFKSLYQQLIALEKVDFQGSPLSGLQIMGMLESRNLDFETVILTSVNEGILPSGKSENSFIPYDVKHEFKIPTYREKDAIYSYHFYHLLQRAKTIYLLYTTEPEAFGGGERSRLLTQLEMDENINKYVVNTIAAPLVQTSNHKKRAIKKTPSLIQELKTLASQGFSPTSLTNYIRDPLDFYRKSILKIKESDKVEDTIAHNTFGTLIHDSLETLYTPLTNQFLTAENIAKVGDQIPFVLGTSFQKTLPGINYKKGNYLMVYHVIEKYLQNFVHSELRQLKKHRIKIIALEEKLSTTIEIPALDFPIRLKGTIDRVDEMDGTTRIIDYKTGAIASSEVSLLHWDDLIHDHKYSKAFQLLSYSLLYHANYTITTFEAGIVPLRKNNAEILRFATKRTARGAKDHTIDLNVLQAFSTQLVQLIHEIFNADIPFAEKEVPLL
ncbi:MAG: PD-(D/E)XK nuclease family protein [Bacteroidota bacterium]